jgi:hypothetical protein
MKCNIFNIGLKNKILILLIIVLILIAINMYVTRIESFASFNDTDMDKLEKIERMCVRIDKKRKLDEQLEEISKNETMHFQLTELDKKIEELSAIVGDLTSRNKKQKYVNKKCRSNKQTLVNKNYDIVNKLNEKGLVNDEVLKIDLNVSDRLKQLKRGVQATGSKGCKKKPGNRDMVNISENKALIEDKCIGCKIDKLIK